MRYLFSLGLAMLSITAISQNSSDVKLVVGIVVDQMRTDYLYRYWDKFEEGGFKRLVNEGYFCRNAHFNYVPTYTGPGHASIYSGTTPATHGIIANNWYEKSSKEVVYCVSDDGANGLGCENKNGKMSPHRLKVPTLGDAIRVSTQFKGKSVGISIKDRGAILPAGHSANEVYWFDYESGNFVTSDYYTSTLPNWLIDFNKKKHADRLAKEPWETSLAIHHYDESTPDQSPYEKGLVNADEPVFPYDVEAAIKEKGYYAFAGSPYGNTILRMLAEECLINAELGQDDHLDLLSISFSSPDIIGHAYGPQSVEVEDTYLKLDREIAELLDALDTRVGAGKYALFLTADHAAAQVPSYMQDNKIPMGYFNRTPLLEALETALTARFNVEGLIENYSNQQIFLNWEKMLEHQLEFKRVSEVIQRVAMDFDGVANVLDYKELQHPLPPSTFSARCAMGWNPQRSGDIIVQYLPGWMEYGPKGTTHGTA